MSEVKEGIVKCFNNSKGYGFISPSSGGNDLFVHMSNIQMDGFKSLTDGQSVEYKEGATDRGPVAEEVTPK